MSKKPKQEPVAYFDPQGRGFYWAKPTMIDAPTIVDVPHLPLYTAPPAAAPEPEPVFDGQLGHSVMLPRAPVPVLGLISDEARAALKAADAVESQEAYRTRAVAPDETEALRRDAERLRGLLAEAQKAVWMNYDGELLDRIEAALKEVPR